MTFFGPVLQISLVIKVIVSIFIPLLNIFRKGIQLQIFKKKLSYMINFGFPRPSLAVIFIFTSIRAATHGIRLLGETLSGA